VFSEEDGWDVLAEIPEATAGLLVLLEHCWAIELVSAAKAEALASVEGDAL
jgi:hypothetical protein